MKINNIVLFVSDLPLKRTKEVPIIIKKKKAIE